MKYFPEREEYELSDGTVLYAEKGIIGISQDLIPREGYTGTFERCEVIPNMEALSCNYHYPEFTTEHKKEIAEYMISLWNEYAKT